MFPIPFNFPFRKKDGSITTISDAISSGGSPYELPTASANTKGGIKIGNRLTMTGEVLSADAQIPTYTESDNGKVLTVNDSGELEWDTKGSGGGDYVMSWDFTKFGNLTRRGVTFSNSGAEFNANTDYIPLITLDGESESALTQFKDKTFYFDIGAMSLIMGANHQRFIMVSTERGFIYRSSGNGVWSLYNNSWTDSEITDGGYFDNSKLKIYIDSENKWHMYKNNVLFFEPNVALPISVLSLGASSSSITSGVIKGVRVYNGNYTET